MADDKNVEDPNALDTTANGADKENDNMADPNTNLLMRRWQLKPLMTVLCQVIKMLKVTRQKMPLKTPEESIKNEDESGSEETKA